LKIKKFKKTPHSKNTQNKSKTNIKTTENIPTVPKKAKQRQLAADP
jgi:hypothetical protein